MYIDVYTKRIQYLVLQRRGDTSWGGGFWVPIYIYVFARSVHTWVGNLSMFPLVALTLMRIGPTTGFSGTDNLN
jgi:hypothetical protein